MEAGKASCSRAYWERSLSVWCEFIPYSQNQKANLKEKQHFKDLFNITFFSNQFHVLSWCFVGLFCFSIFFSLRADSFPTPRSENFGLAEGKWFGENLSDWILRGRHRGSLLPLVSIVGSHQVSTCSTLTAWQASWWWQLYFYDTPRAEVQISKNATWNGVLTSGTPGSARLESDLEQWGIEGSMDGGQTCLLCSLHFWRAHLNSTFIFFSYLGDLLQLCLPISLIRALPASPSL